MHLLFYDGNCGLCDHLVQFILKVDSKKIFLFAPSHGSTAKLILKQLPQELQTEDSLLLVENYQHPETERLHLLGKGALRIFWLLGGKWCLLGLLSFLPAAFSNWLYRLVARNRHRFFSLKSCQLPTYNSPERFLP
jgi:predicted DCC family thiol-disulfide oxidoreductase YuxK